MSGYHYAKKITVDNAPETKPAHMCWVTRRPRYQVRSDGGGMSTRFDDCTSLTQARKIAKERARACGWAEVFQWAEDTCTLRKFFIALYDRELTL